MGGFGVTAPAQLVYFITAPAYPHATWVAVYPAFLFHVMQIDDRVKSPLRKNAELVRLQHPWLYHHHPSVTKFAPLRPLVFAEKAAINALHFRYSFFSDWRQIANI